MITRYLNKFMQRWLLSLGKEMLKEAKWLRSEGRESEAMMMACLAHAVTMADGRV
jgi:hypothetical protein